MISYSINNVKTLYLKNNRHLEYPKRKIDITMCIDSIHVLQNEIHKVSKNLQ